MRHTHILTVNKEKNIYQVYDWDEEQAQATCTTVVGAEEISKQVIPAEVFTAVTGGEIPSPVEAVPKPETVDYYIVTSGRILHSYISKASRAVKKVTEDAVYLGRGHNGYRHPRKLEEAYVELRADLAECCGDCQANLNLAKHELDQAVRTLKAFDEAPAAFVKETTYGVAS